MNEKLKRVCAWCKKGLENKDGDFDLEKAPITHGICPDCLRNILSFEAIPLNDFLDRFSWPVFVVDENVKVKGANNKAMAVLGKKFEDIVEKLGGEVFDCVNAAQGCGSTIHCKSCTLRKTVTDTYKTGRSHYKIPAYPDLHYITKEKVRFLISTEKRGNAVFLQIEEIEDKN